MSLLILGADGLIGAEFARCARRAGVAWQGTCFARPAPTLLPLDVRQPGALEGLLERLSPDTVVNAVGLAGGVDWCESHPEAGRLFHVELTRRLADWCAASGAALLFLSTDYVFDDAQPSRGEEDAPRPLNLYGQLKLEAEAIVRARVERHLIARTTNVYGWDPGTTTPNFPMQLAAALRERGRAAAPAYLEGNPTLAADLAAAMLDLHGRQRWGLYHIVGPDHVSRLAWARVLAGALGFPAAAVEEIAAPPAGAVARPLRLELRTGKLRAAQAPPLRGVAEGARLFAAAAAGREGA